MMLLSLLFILAACTNTESEPNTITVAELTEREEGLLSTMAEQSFVFDFHVDKEYEEVAVWVEKYEFGKLVTEDMSRMTTTVKENGSLIFATSKTTSENKDVIFNIGISGENGSASIIDMDQEAADLTDMSSIWGSLSESKNLTDKETVLASIAYSSNDFGMSSLTNDFYDDMEAHIDELEEYDVAYILKAQFKK